MPALVTDPPLLRTKCSINVHAAALPNLSPVTVSKVMPGLWQWSPPHPPTQTRARLLPPDRQGRGVQGLVQGCGAPAGPSYPRTGHHLHVVRAHPDLRGRDRRRAQVITSFSSDQFAPTIHSTRFFFRDAKIVAAHAAVRLLSAAASVLSCLSSRSRYSSSSSSTWLRCLFKAVRRCCSRR